MRVVFRFLMLLQLLFISTVVYGTISIDELLLAVKKGDIDSATEIINQISQDQLDYPVTRTGGSVLHAAIQGGYRLKPEVKQRLVRQLLKRGADPNFRDNSNKTPLFYLPAKKHSIDVLKIMLDADADIHMRDVSGQTLMHLFAQKNADTIVKNLLQAGASHALLDKKGLSPLILAMSKKATKVTRILLDAGADISSSYLKGNSILHYAARANDLRTIEHILKMGLSIDLKNRQGETALSLLASSTRWASVRYLLKREADPNVPMRREMSVALYLLMNPDLGMSQLINKDKINVNVGGQFLGRSPLLKTLKTLDLEALKVLIALGVDINAKLSNGQFALPYVTNMPIVSKNRLPILKLLLDSKADVDIKQYLTEVFCY